MDRSEVRGALRNAWVASLGYAAMAALLGVAGLWLDGPVAGRQYVPPLAHGLVLGLLAYGVYRRSLASAGLLLIYGALSTLATPVWWVAAAAEPALVFASALWTLQAAGGLLLVVTLVPAVRGLRRLERTPTRGA